MPDNGYLMDNEEEPIRLVRKTDFRVLKKQALWAGLKPGMRVADIGCGPGITTFYLNRLIKPGGSVVGIDNSEKQIEYAVSNYMDEGVEYKRDDIRKLKENPGLFDFIWVRFFLEFFRSTSFSIVKKLKSLLKPGGILCLIDLDHNCLSHYGIPDKVENVLFGIIRALEEKADYDPYAGRKLYSYLYDANFQDIRVHVSVHHLIYGQIGEDDAYNWRKKIEIAAKNSGYCFKEFKGGFKGFEKECQQFFQDPRRFTYTPVISCRGRKAKPEFSRWW